MKYGMYTVCVAQSIYNIQHDISLIESEAVLAYIN